jgi:hypothetical protein
MFLRDAGTNFQPTGCDNSEDRNKNLSNFATLFFRCFQYVSILEKKIGDTDRNIWKSNAMNVTLENSDFLLMEYPSGRTMALGSTQPLTEMSTRNLPGG